MIAIEYSDDGERWERIDVRPTAPVADYTKHGPWYDESIERFYRRAES